MQTQESKIDMGKAIDADLVVTESSGTKSEIQPIYDEEPLAGILRLLKSKTIEQTTSLLANNADLKAQIQEKIFTGHRFSSNKTSAVYEKTSSISDLRWKPTGRIFKSVGLRWIPTGIFFNSCTSKVDSEPLLELESLFGSSFDEYFNGENQVVSKSSAVTTADASDKRQQQPDSTSSTSTLATTVSADGNFDL
ncbi:hypothetical protein Tco_0159078 [Tanacetum coccineum]